MGHPGDPRASIRSVPLCGPDPIKGPHGREREREKAFARPTDGAATPGRPYQHQGPRIGSHLLQQGRVVFYTMPRLNVYVTHWSSTTLISYTPIVLTPQEA
jgi:hypothetical protein